MTEEAFLFNYAHEFGNGWLSTTYLECARGIDGDVARDILFENVETFSW